MNRINYLLCKRILCAVLAKTCKSSIPRSGDEGARVNCFVTAVDRGGRPYLVVRDIDGDDLLCVEWDGSGYRVQRRVALQDFCYSDFRITHYYGLDTLEFLGLLGFVANHLCPWRYLLIHLHRRLDKVGQFFFNKKKFYTKQRIELLKFLVDRALDGQAQHNPIDLMTGLYSLRWFLHPEGIQQ